MKRKILDILPSRFYLELKHWGFKITNESGYKEMQDRRLRITDDGYSLKPFDDKRAIFVHIPKCAGVSINKTIFGNLAGGHTTLEGYFNVFEPQCIYDYFKFTIVRNPWDRVVSAYFFLKNGGFGERDSLWFKSELDEFKNFEDFVKNWLNKGNIWKWHHFRPQYHYMLDKRGKAYLDFVAFLENLDEDFLYITNRLGLDCALPNSNKSKHSSYMNYYNDETVEIVSKVYEEDIKMLEYSFDNSNIKNQLANRNSKKIYSLES